jgi:hypothetical protein
MHHERTGLGTSVKCLQLIGTTTSECIHVAAAQTVFMLSPLKVLYEDPRSFDATEAAEETMKHQFIIDNKAFVIWRGSHSKR